MSRFPWFDQSGSLKLRPPKTKFGLNQCISTILSTGSTNVSLLLIVFAGFHSLTFGELK